MINWFKPTVYGIAIGSLLAAATTSLAQDEKPAKPRNERLRRMERAIERLEQQFPRLNQEAAERQLREALDAIDLHLSDGDRFVMGVVLNVQVEATSDDEESAVSALVIAEVHEDSAAADAGIQAGDVIVSVNGEPIDDPDNLIEAVQATQGEKPLTLSLQRDGEKFEAKVTPRKQDANTTAIPGLNLDTRILSQDGESFVFPDMPKVGRAMVFGNNEELKEDIATLRQDVDALRDQMKELSAQIKELKQLLKK